MFHIEHGLCTNTDNAREITHEELSMDGSWGENDSDGICRSEKLKDDIRKYYALKELLATEVGYLLDLRALVTVRIVLRICSYNVFTSDTGRYTFVFYPY
jgi:hypothetical protein